MNTEHDKTDLGCDPVVVKSQSQKAHKAQSVVAILLSAILLVLIISLGAVLYLVNQFFAIPGKISEGARQQILSSVNEMREAGLAVAESIRGALNFKPVVLFEDDILEHGSTNVRHVVLRETQFKQERTFTHTFLGSTKRLEVVGEFRARGGLDLGRRSRILIKEDVIIVELPEPEVLSVELQEVQFLRDVDGLWNRIRPEEREEHVNTLLQRARQTAQRLLPSEALRSAARKAVMEAVAPLTGVKVEVIFVKHAPDNPSVDESSGAFLLH